MNETPILRKKTSGYYGESVCRKIVLDVKILVVERFGKQEDNITTIVDMVKKICNKIDDLLSENAAPKEFVIGSESSR